MDTIDMLIRSSMFLLVNFLVLLAVLRLNQRQEKPVVTAEPDLPESGREPGLPAVHALAWEFEYARESASQAMQDRHTIVNFYLLIAGVLTSGVVTLISPRINSQSTIGTLLMWLLCLVGWFYFLQLIRLRQAWQESARAMNQIKEFSIRNVEKFTPREYGHAFRWRAHTLPAAGKPWTLFFYSAALIGFIDSAAFVAGGVLLDLEAAILAGGPFLAALGVLGLALMAFHIWLYFAFLN